MDGELYPSGDGVEEQMLDILARQVASPVNFGSEAKQYRRAPQRNEHFDDIVRYQLGYDDERIAKLKAEGAFGTAKDEVRA